LKADYESHRQDSNESLMNSATFNNKIEGRIVAQSCLAVDLKHNLNLEYLQTNSCDIPSLLGKSKLENHNDDVQMTEEDSHANKMDFKNLNVIYSHHSNLEQEIDLIMPLLSKDEAGIQSEACSDDSDG